MGSLVGGRSVVKAVGVDRAYAAWAVRLSWLTPDIAEAILVGEEPDGFSLMRLLKELLMYWEGR